MKVFYKGAMLLIVAALIGECIEVFINIVLARVLGEEGLGLYMSIVPAIIFVVVLATIELPVSISKLVAEKERIFHRSMMLHALRFAFVWAVACMIISLWIHPFIPIFKQYHPLTPWLFIAFIPTMTFSAVARGYFMGAQQMGKIAINNVLERTAQLVLLFIVFKIFAFTSEIAIFIALCILVASEIVGLAYMFFSLLLQLQLLKREPRALMKGRKVRDALLKVSVPTTGLRIFHAASFAVKPFLIQRALVQAGMMESMAIAQYGNLAGVAFTIGFFPAFIAHSLLIVLIPTVSAASTRGEFSYLRSLLRKVIGFTAGYGIPAIFIFYFYAEPLTSFFFENSPSVRYLQLLILYFLFHFFVIPLQAFLIGLGLVKDAFIHGVYATLFSFVLMYVLGALPTMQMDGIIIGMNVGAVLLTLMHYVTVCQKIDVTFLLQNK